MPAISVAMITMNEERAIGKVLDDLARELEGHDAEIVVVDSSRDETPRIAAAKGARVIRQFPPQGYGRAMDRALRESAGDVIVTLDCDDTYPADQVVPLANMVLRGECDLVNASRLGRRPTSMPLANYLANRLFAAVSSLVSGRYVTDVHSGMRAYRRTMLEKLSFDPSGPALPVELLLKPIVKGYRVREVFIEYRDRIGVSTLQRFSSTVWTFRRILRSFAWRLEGQA